MPAGPKQLSDRFQRRSDLWGGSIGRTLFMPWSVFDGHAPSSSLPLEEADMLVPSALRRAAAPLATAFVLTALALWAPTLTAQEIVTGDWPQWRGPARDGAAPGFEAPNAWPEELELVWEREVGHSDSPPVVDGSRVFVFVREAEEEVLLALDKDSGETLWRGAYPAPFQPVSIVGDHGAGPFASPLVLDGTVYTFGITQILTAWDAATGELRWQRGFDDEFEKVPAFYGNSVSPAIEGGKLIVAVGGPAGGAVLALDPTDGTDLWRNAGEEGPAYGSITVAELGGEQQVVLFLQKHLVGLRLDDGELLWRLPFRVPFDAASLTPLVLGDLVIVSSDRTPTEAHRVSRSGNGEWTLELVWSNKDVGMAYSTPVLTQGKLVVFSTKKKGQLVVLNPESGEVIWEGEPRLGANAFLTTGGGVVFAVADDGRSHVLDLRESPVVPRSYEVAESAVWNYPVLLDRHLVIKDWSHVRVWSLTPPTPGSATPTNTSEEANNSEDGAR